jgi:anaerobic ribonucleoside-triphosphate reductase
LSIPHRVRGVRILKAVSSPVRLQILNLLFDKGPLSYTELLGSLKMNPTRDAGRFAYHLKFLLKADLVEGDIETKKYCLTELGKTVIDVADRIEKKALRPKGMLVRTSRIALEEFDSNKIANSLVKEAKMPTDLAQKVAKEAEKRLVKSRTKYLTAPLVREVVDAILIEKGLEEYRHKLTRLGLPVYDVASLIGNRGNTLHESASIDETAGEIVLKEYTLLNTLPRDIADAHVSGSLHIRNLNSWILRPTEIMHDLRFFLQNGLDLERINPLQPSFPAPQTLESALSMASDVLLHSAREVDELQTLDYFNIFISPFVKDMQPTRVREALRSFIFNVNQHTKASLCLELTTPQFIAEEQAVGPLGKNGGNYGDFRHESQLVASLVLEIFGEESSRKPFSSPRLLVKVRAEVLNDEKARAMLLEAHRLASEKGICYFANLLSEDGKCSGLSASGFRLKSDLNSDWEIDTLRTGCLGQVAVNIPRIAVESNQDKAKFLDILRERLEMATRALEIKYNAVKQNGKGLLPFLTQNVNGDQYFRLENCSWVMNMIGVKEAVEIFYEKSVYESEKTLELVDNITNDVQDLVRKSSRRRGRRLFPATLPDSEASQRLAQLDIERQGIAKVRYSGAREKPFYSALGKLALQDGKVPENSLAVERKISAMRAAGGLTVIDLGDVEHKPEELVALTKQTFESCNVDVLAYDRKFTYCANCRRSWLGLLRKCPSCNATSTLTFFDQFASL